jgi:hypothetical protein
MIGSQASRIGSCRSGIPSSPDLENIPLKGLNARSELLVLFLDPFDKPQFILISNERYSSEQIGRIDVAGARTLAAVDIYAHVTCQPRAYGGKPQFSLLSFPDG